MGLIYLYTRLEVTLDALSITALFDEDRGSGLDALSDTLSTILTETTLSELYTTQAIRDILEIHAFSTKDLEVQKVLEEFQLLTALIRSRIEKTQCAKYGMLRAIHLEHPNTLILEFVRAQAPTKPRFAIKETRCRRSLCR